MKTRRREFLKMAGMVGISLSTAHELFAQHLEKEKNLSDLPRRIEEYQKEYRQGSINGLPEKVSLEEKH